MKRKESLKSPVKQKKSRESLDIASPIAVAVSEQRKRAKEWAESEAKKESNTTNEKDNKAKRAATPTSKTPAKKSKTEVAEVVEEILAPRSTRKSVSRSSISAPAQFEDDVQPAAKSRRTPAKKAQKVEESESEEEEEEEVPAPAPKPVRKTPAKAPAPVKAAAKTPSKTPSKAAVSSAASSSSPIVAPKVNTPERQVSPVAVVSRVREASPKPTAPRYQEQEPEEEVVVERRIATTSSGDSLSPPNALLTVMIQVYIVVAGVAYLDAGTGFLLFLAVNVLANLVVLSSLSAEE